MGAAGGGGTANNIAFPYSDNNSQPTWAYTKWVVLDLEPMIEAAMSTPSPYSNESVPEHDGLFGTSAATTQARLTAFKDIVDGLDEEDDFATHVAAAITQAASAFPATSVATDIVTIQTAERSATSTTLTAALTAAAAVVAGTPIADMVTAYEAKIKKQYHAAMSRFTSGMADINAVNSSAFIWGMASIERELLDSIAEYTAGLDVEAYKTAFVTYMDTFKSTFEYHLKFKNYASAARDNFITQSVPYIGSLAQTRLKSQFEIVSLQRDLNTLIYEANIAQFNRNIEIDVEDTLWDWKLYAFGGNMLAAAGGAATVPQQMTPGQQRISGAATGAAAGAAIGMIVPGISTVVGAGVGAAVGLLASNRW